MGEEMQGFDEGTIGLGLTTDSESIQEIGQVDNQPEDKGTAPDWSTAPRSSGINTPSTKIGESVRGETEDASGEDDSGEEEAPARTNAKDGQPGSNSNDNHRLCSLLGGTHGMPHQNRLGESYHWLGT